MKYHFQLQFKMLNRHIIEFGLPPLLGYALGMLSFVGFSLLLFIKAPDYAEYVYAALGMLSVSIFSEKERNDFLKLTLKKSLYHRVRMLENALVVLPFAVFLAFQKSWLGVAMILLSMLLSLFSAQNQWSYAIPTPFSKRPFEFIVGFRKVFYVFLGAYFWTYMAISVGNFNLGIFALLVVFFTCFSFYSEPEDTFFVWIFSMTSKAFIAKKITTALLFSTLLSLPIVVSLAAFFDNNLIVLVIAQLLGYLYLITVLLAKYAAYPRQISVPQAVIIILGLWLPPMLLGIIPFFYQQSIKKLNNFLA